MKRAVPQAEAALERAATWKPGDPRLSQLWREIQSAKTPAAPELPPAEELSTSAPEAWSDDLDISVLGPVRGISEVVFFHIPTGSLVLTDLAFNMTRSARSLDRIVWRSSGISYGFGPGRTSRRLLLRDHAQASRCLSRVSEWPIRRIVVAHHRSSRHR